MSNSLRDIPVKYINSTGDIDFSVIVSTKNFDDNADNGSFDAWKVLRAQTSSQFVYPASLSVAASYRSQGQLITAGPYPANPGDTWNIIKQLPTDTAVIRKG